MSCPYCTPDKITGLTEEIASNEYKSAEVMGNQLWVRLCYELDTDWIGHPSGEIDGFFDIRHCPMCGRKL